MISITLLTRNSIHLIYLPNQTNNCHQITVFVLVFSGW